MAFTCAIRMLTALGPVLQYAIAVTTFITLIIAPVIFVFAHAVNAITTIGRVAAVILITALYTLAVNTEWKVGIVAITVIVLAPGRHTTFTTRALVLARAVVDTAITIRATCIRSAPAIVTAATLAITLRRVYIIAHVVAVRAIPIHTITTIRWPRCR